MTFSFLPVRFDEMNSKELEGRMSNDVLFFRATFRDASKDGGVNIVLLVYH